MSHSLKSAVVSLGCAMAALAAAPAWTAQIVQSDAIAIDESYLFHPVPVGTMSALTQDYTYSNALTFAAFDTSLGTLTGVNLALSGPQKLRGGGSIVRAAGQGNGVLYFGQSYYTWVKVGADLYPGTTDGSLIYCTTDDAPACLSQSETNDIASVNQSFAGLSSFLGSSPITLNMLTELYLNGIIQGDTPVPLYTVNGRFTWTGTATLTYTYDAAVIPPPSDVPEPSSWALMLGGFGLVGAAMRRRPRAAFSFG
jgi:hypothetical protein